MTDFFENNNIKIKKPNININNNFKPVKFSPHIKVNNNSLSRKIGKYLLTQAQNGTRSLDNWLFGVLLLNKGHDVAKLYLEDGIGASLNYIKDYTVFLTVINPATWNYAALKTGIKPLRLVGHGMRAVYSGAGFSLIFARMAANDGRAFLDRMVEIGIHNKYMMWDCGVVSDVTAKTIHKSLVYAIEPLMKYELERLFGKTTYQGRKQYQEYNYRDTYIISLPQGNYMTLPYKKLGDEMYHDHYISYLQDKSGHIKAFSDDQNFVRHKVSDKRKIYYITHENGQKQTVSYQLTQYPVMTTEENRYFMETPNGYFEVAYGETYRHLQHRISEMKDMGFDVDEEGYALYYPQYCHAKAVERKNNEIKLSNICLHIQKRKENIKKTIKLRSDGHHNNHLTKNLPSQQYITRVNGHDRGFTNYRVYNPMTEADYQASTATLVKANDIVYIKDLKIAGEHGGYFVYVGRDDYKSQALNMWSKAQKVYAQKLYCDSSNLKKSNLFIATEFGYGANHKVEISPISNTHLIMPTSGNKIHAFWENEVVYQYNTDTLEPIRTKEAFLMNDESLVFDEQSNQLIPMLDIHAKQNLNLYYMKHNMIPAYSKYNPYLALENR